MIIYVSSYPRSGSSLMQQIVNNFFEQPWTEVDQTKRSLNKITGVPEYFENWRYDSQVLFPSNSLLTNYWHKLNRNFLKIYNLERWIALYDLSIPPYTKNCRYLLPGCKDVLTLANRQQLAQEETCFFVKTHHLPHDEYLDKEYVLQIVRHPAQVFLSYLNFIHTYNQNSTKDLEEVIRGNVPYGSWSKWHQTWNQAMPKLKNRFLRLKFENVLSTEKSLICDQIKSVINLDYNPEKHEPSFEELKRNYPKYYKAGKRDQWRSKYSEAQIKLIKNIHNHTIKDLDYSLP